MQETETQVNVNEDASDIEAIEVEEENEFLKHIHKDLRSIFAHEETDGDVVSRGADGNISMVTDLFALSKDSRNPEWGNHDFGQCKWHADSTRYDLEQGDYVLEVIPQVPRYVMVPAKDEETGEVKLVRRRERTITVLQSQVKPLAHGVSRTQTDVWAQGLMRDRTNEEKRLAKAAEKAANKAAGKASGGRRKSSLLLSASVSGSLICVPENGKLLLFRDGSGSPEPEATFDANPEGYAARDAYCSQYANRPPAPEVDDESGDTTDDA